MVKVTTQTLENRQVELAIEVEDARVQQALQQAARKIAGQINIPGFRKGKAPYAIVQRAVGEKALYEEMLEALGPELLREALREAELDPFRPLEMREVQLKPLAFKVTVPLAPIVELGDYRSLRVPFQVQPVPDAQIESLLEGIRQRNTVVEPAGDGPAEWGHIASLDLSATLGEEKEALDFSEVADESGAVQLLLDQARDPLLPGLSAAIVGMRVGEEKTFDLRVPDDFEDESLRGETLAVTARLGDLKRTYTPPLDDALAQTVGNYETLDQLRAAVRATMEKTAAMQAEAAYADECVAQLAQAAHIEFPPVLVDEELDRLIQEVEQRLQSQKMSLDEMLNIKKQSRQDYREEMRPRASARLRQALALGEFVRAENLADGGESSQELVTKAISRLVSICKGEFSTAQPGGEQQPAEAAAGPAE